MPDILNQTVALADCRDNPRNYNTHDAEQIANLAASLRQFGQVRSVVVQDDPAGYVIVAGHGVITAARRLGWPSLRADVIPADWPPDRVLAYLAADNELARASSPDDAQLAALVAELAEQGDAELARLAAGSAARLEELLASLTGDETGDETTDAGDQTAQADAAQAKWQVKPGDLWTLGAHKLLCGDSTDPAQVARLMGDDRARLAFTDPPYGVSYVDKFRQVTNGRVAGDELRRDGLIALLQPALRNLVDFSLGEAAFYIWHASDTRREFEWVLDAVGLQERQYITWVKDGFSLGHADYHWACEYVFYATRAGHSCPFYGGRDQTTIWRLGATTEQAVFVIGDGLLISDGRASTLFIKTSAPRGKKWRTLRLTPGQEARLRAEHPTGTDAWHVTRDPVADYWHPTQKPAALARRAIQNHTEAGEIVLDLFGGSGSTLLAAQAEGRQARLCELKPKFCAAVLERFVLSGGPVPTREAAPQP